MTFHGPEPRIIELEAAGAERAPAVAAPLLDEDSGTRAVDKLGWEENPSIEFSELDPGDADLLAPFIVGPQRLGFGKETLAVLAPVFIVQLARAEAAPRAAIGRWLLLAAAMLALVLCTASVAYAL